MMTSEMYISQDTFLATGKYGIRTVKPPVLMSDVIIHDLHPVEQFVFHGKNKWHECLYQAPAKHSYYPAQLTTNGTIAQGMRSNTPMSVSAVMFYLRK